MIRYRMVATAFVLVLSLSLCSCGMKNAQPEPTDNSKLADIEEKKGKGPKPEKESSASSSENNDQPEVQNDQIETSAEPSSEGKNEQDGSAASSTSGGLDSSAAVYEPVRVDSDSLTWEFDEQTGTLSIHGQGPMRDYSQDYPEWEQYADSILKVALDEGITSIGRCAFFNYGNLVEAVLPDSIEVVDDEAFYWNWSLKMIHIPTSLKYVGEGAFYNTLIWEPQDLVFPEGCEYIGDNAFHSALKTEGIVSLPSTLKYLGNCAFTNAFVSDYIVAGNNSVYCCYDHAVYTKDMKVMLMLAPVAAFGKEYAVPDGVERICPECFNLIRGIETVRLPASVMEIPEQTFFGNYDLKEIIVDEANPNYRSMNGLLLSKDGKMLLAWPDGMELEEIVIPDGVERLGENLFYGRFDRSYSVFLPEGVKEIGSFSLPSMMDVLTLPVSLSSIEDYVFYDGMTLGSIDYQGTLSDWEKITIGQGNYVLDSAQILMK